MDGNQNKVSVSGAMITSLALLTAIALEEGFVSDPGWYDVLYITIPLLLILSFVSRHNASETSTTSRG
jgi:hypothetical protein